MTWGITGASHGVRQPVSYNLRSGQFRGMGTVRGYSNTTIINNNIYGGGSCHSFGNYNYGCNCQQDSTPKWMNWMMGIGMGTNFLGNILDMFGQAKSDSTEGAGGKETNKETKAATDPCKELKELFKNENINFSYKDGTYYARVDGETFSDNTFDGIVDKLNNRNKTSTPQQPPQAAPTVLAQPTVEPTVVEEPKVEESLPRLFNDSSQFGSVADVLSSFSNLTGANAAKIDDNASGITVNSVVDKGNGTSMKVNINLSSSQMTQIKNLGDNQSLSLGTIAGKPASAENVDGYIRLKIGGQTYMVGQDSSGKFNAYQYQNGNVIGYSETNWRR